MDLRIPTARWSAFFGAFAEVISDVEAGCEDVRLRIAVEDGRLNIELSEDAPGVDWMRVAQRACAAGLSAEDDDDPPAPAAADQAILHPSLPPPADVPRSMSEDHWQVVSPLIAASCEELFSAYGVPLQQLADGAGISSVGVGALIGLISDEMRGNMTITAAPAVIGQIGGTAAEVEEWIVELANQLLGRLKNKLLPYGIALYPSTPVCQKGIDLSRRRTAARLFVFNADPGPVCVEFNAALDPAFVFPSFPLLNSSPLAEGEMLLF